MERAEKRFDVTNDFGFFILAVVGDCGGGEEDDSGRLLSLVGILFLLMLTI